MSGEISHRLALAKKDKTNCLLNKTSRWSIIDEAVVCTKLHQTNSKVWLSKIQKVTSVQTSHRYVAQSNLQLLRSTRPSVVTLATKKTRNNTLAAQSQFHAKKKVQPGSQSKLHHQCHDILHRRAAFVLGHWTKDLISKCRSWRIGWYAAHTVNGFHRKDRKILLRRNLNSKMEL